TAGQERAEIATAVLRPRALIDRGEHRPGLGHVDDRGLLRLAAHEEVGIVVGQARDRDDAHRFSLAACRQVRPGRASYSTTSVFAPPPELGREGRFTPRPSRRDAPVLPLLRP